MSEVVAARFSLSDTLTVVKGLNSIIHIEPSYISVLTVYNSEGDIPEVFLRWGCIADGLIVYATLSAGKNSARITTIITLMNKIPTEIQISAGGVAYRKDANVIEIAVISVGRDNRWQLPKGIIDKGESIEGAAIREVREEAGIETELIDLIDKIEYWYYSKSSTKRIRFHKFVYFYLLKYMAGNTEDHDKEVNEARWVNIDTAQSMLTFKGEKAVVARAKEMIKSVE